MKLAVSNIAWDRWNDPAVFSLLRTYGVDGIEIAPGKIAGNAVDVVRRVHEEAGFVIPALQAILFGHPELQVFDHTTHAAFLKRFSEVAELACGLGARVLVFGAPKNRRRFGMSLHDSEAMAIDFFRQAGEIVRSKGCVIGLEPNPVDYQCDFLTNIGDVRNFVKLVDNEGVRVHFDSGAVIMNQGVIAEEIKNCDFVHYHISAPQLANVADFPTGQAMALKTLVHMNYDGWISVEMKRGEPELGSLERALKSVRGWIDEAEP